MTQADALGELKANLRNSLQPGLRKDAELRLADLERNPGFVGLLIHAIADNSSDLATRQAAALLFKNLLKRAWGSEESSIQLTEDDRILVKSQIVDLMIYVPSQVRVQLSEIVSIVAQYDFPEKWPQLIDQLTSKLSQSDYATNCGVLETAHSIFKRWRSLYRSNELFTEIKFVLDKFCPTYLELWKQTDAEFKKLLENKSSVNAGTLCSIVNLLVQIFYDLNVQDLPEFFEDNMPIFMSFLTYYLTVSDQMLQSSDPDESSAIDNVKAGICSIVELYSRRYEDAFPMLKSFVETIWKLLTQIGPEPRYDEIVSKGLSCLSTVVKLHNQRSIVGNEDVLRQFTEQIVLPNMTMRSVDEELFEDDPIEYIRRDLESGADVESRRSAATDFVRSLMTQFEGDVTQIISGYIVQYLHQYNADPVKNWKAKDTAIYLLTSIASQGTSASGSVSTNKLVNVVDFFSQNIYSDLSPDAKLHPIIQVDAVRYLYTFRGLLTKEQLLSVIPVLSKLLRSEHYAVHTFAAIAIERILVLKVNKVSVIAAADIAAYNKEILTNVFVLIKYAPTPEKMAENDYLMRCVMRTIVVSKDSLMKQSVDILDDLIKILGEVSKNPSNPRFNHYLFESIGGLIKYDAITSAILEQIESRLFGPFQAILQLDITEFSPYVFQLLAQLLEAHSSSDFPLTYQGLIVPSMTPSLWDQKGNIPALTRLLIAFLDHGAQNIVQNGHLSSVLGIFQRLASQKSTEQFGFDLLEAFFRYTPQSACEEYLKGIFFFLFTRLQNAGSDRFAANLAYIIFFFLAMEKDGRTPDHLLAIFDSIQQGIFLGLLQMVLLPQVKHQKSFLSRKIAIIGLTKLLTSSPRMLNPPENAAWPSAMNALLGLLLLPSEVVALEPDEIELDLNDENAFQSAFSQLATTARVKTDPFASINDPASYAIQEFRRLKSADPQRLSELLAGASTELVGPFVAQL